jgi:hypothetical protein
VRGTVVSSAGNKLADGRLVAAHDAALARALVQ